MEGNELTKRNVIRHEIRDKTFALVKAIPAITFKHYAIVSSFLLVLLTLICYWLSSYLFSFFSLDLFLYTDFSDVFLISFQNGLVTFLVMTLPILFLISLRVLPILFIRSVKKVINESKVWWVKPANVLQFLFTISVLVFVIFIFGNVARSATVGFKARLILDGYSPRYLVDLKTKENLGCVSIIAITSDYYFLWNHYQKQAITMSKANVLSIRKIISQAEGISMLDNNDSRISDARVIWSDNLKNLCNQNIVWE